MSIRNAGLLGKYSEVTALSDLNKIPFGLRVSDNKFVDVHDVPNGKQCGCICPSCSTPLESRQGDRNIWHFAHSSKKVYEKTKNECEYSFYLSLRLMARQLIGKQLTLCLPEYKGTIEYYEGILRFPQYKEFTVTKKPDITLTDIEVESKFSGVSVDIIGKIDTFQFVIYFTHPDRTIPDKLFNPENTKCGVIEISLCSLFGMFMNAKNEDKTYYEILTNFLENDKHSKSWVYHPNFKKYTDVTIEELKINASNFTCTKISQINYSHLVAQDIQTIHDYSPLKHIEREDKEMNDFLKEHERAKNKSQKTRMNDFKCVMCGMEWSGSNICPKCNTHLYSRIME